MPTTDFPAAFAALREILARHAGGMIVVADTSTTFTVSSPAMVQKDKPLFFGCVTLMKSAVTYHLFPLYFNPKLQAAVPAELRPRKQGKTCFNFKRPDAALFAQIDVLTGLAREAFERHGFLEAGMIAPERFNAALRAGGEDPEAIATMRKAKGKEAARKRAGTIKKKAAARPGATKRTRAAAK